MTGVVIRPMAEGDIPQVCALERNTFSEPWSENAFAEELGNPFGVTLAAEEGGRVIGYLNAHVVFESAHLNNLCVAPGARRKGVAFLLLETLCRLAGGRGAQSLTLEVRQSNAPACALYRKLGFEPVGVRRRFYTAPVEDAVLMKKELTDE